MNKITLCKQGIIGDKAVYKQIAAAECASILMFSDSHGDIEAVRWIFKAFGSQCSVCFFAGDGADDIIKIIQETAETSAGGGTDVMPPLIILARGNCDREWHPVMLPAVKAAEITLPLCQRLEIARQTILLTHGHSFEVEKGLGLLVNAAASSGCTIAVHGHTHVQAVDFIRRITVINGGSPQRPRGKSLGGFSVLSIDNPNNKADLTMYALIRDGAGSFSASAHSTVPIGLKKRS